MGSATFWALLPPVIAIVLALLTKEVYVSLMVGILSGALLFAGGNPVKAVESTFDIMSSKIGDNTYILVFLVLLGILVALITKSGASRAYGEWGSRAIKTERGALLATTCLGSLIFVDDYFNCLTVGTVMRPITDKHGISRARLAYIIDATAAPVCIIAPISSWAAAVSSSLPKGCEIDGFTLFLKTIPFNLYALFTIIFMIFLIIIDRNFFAMDKYEKNIHEAKEVVNNDEIEIKGKGKVNDLIFPIAMLIILCIISMIYTGGFFDGGVSIVDAFADCDAGKSLVLGSFTTVVVTFLVYIAKKVLSFTDCCESITAGFKSMTPAILILCFAWTLSGICGEEYLNIGGFVSRYVNAESMFIKLLPAVFFVIALFLAFATGTSWGTFGILIPIAVAVCGTGDALILGVAAILAGAVCGDHISPISDTTILASAGAQCHHIDHVSTQMPYAFCVAVPAFIGFFIGGITMNGWIALMSGAVCLVGVMIWLALKVKKEA